MVYLSYFVFPSGDRQDSFLFAQGINDSYYPFRILSENQLERIDLEPVTILYGGNGSGKSTALNVIAEKLRLNRDSMFNKTTYFDDFVDMCRIDHYEKIPRKSRIITSDDVFDFMLDIRRLNEGIAEKRERQHESYLEARYSDFQFKSMADYDELKRVVASRSKTENEYVNDRVMKPIDTASNGESAFRCFVEKIQTNALYILDEPENSLSPQRQLELKTFIEDSARFYGCQFIISTHSPFLLSIDHAKIYDLDANPVAVQKWTKLENIRTYYNFFVEHQDELEQV